MKRGRKKTPRASSLAWFQSPLGVHRLRCFAPSFSPPLSPPLSHSLNTRDSPAAVSVSEPARTATEPERRASETARRDDEGAATLAATRIVGDDEVVAALQVVARLLPEEEDEAASELAAESGARREASMVSETEGRRTAEVEELPLLVLRVERKRKECVWEKKRGGRKKKPFPLLAMASASEGNDATIESDAVSSLAGATAAISLLGDMTR